MTFLSCIVGEIDGGTTLGIALRDQRNSHCLVCLVFGGVWLFGSYVSVLSLLIIREINLSQPLQRRFPLFFVAVHLTPLSSAYSQLACIVFTTSFAALPLASRLTSSSSHLLIRKLGRVLEWGHPGVMYYGSRAGTKTIQLNKASVHTWERWFRHGFCNERSCIATILKVDPDIHDRFLYHSLSKCEHVFILYRIDFHIGMKTVR